MDRATIEQNLVQTEAYIVQVIRDVAKQRDIVADLEATGEIVARP